MRVLIDITHPAQVHFFKHAIGLLESRGHAVMVTARDKDLTVALLSGLGIEAMVLGRRRRSRAGMAWELLERAARLLGAARRFRPDVLLGRAGVSIGPVGAVLGIPRVIFEDTEHARLQQAVSIPFATFICTGTGYTKEFGPRQVRFRGVPVLAYLHPRWFRPDPGRLLGAELRRNSEPLIVLRRTARSGSHDSAIRRADDEQALWSARRLSVFGKVLVSSEGPLPPSMAPFRCPVPIAHMHDLLALAALYVGDGASMAAEAAALGTPAVYCSRLTTGFLEALRRDYGLLHRVDSLTKGVAVAERLLSEPGLRRTMQQRRRRLLADCEDIPEFIYRMCLRAMSHAPESGRSRRVERDETPGDHLTD